MKPFEEKPYLAILAGILTVAGSMRAAPSLPVTKVPATPNPSYTGPTNDAHAIMGQWFMNVATGKPEYRTHEFYDNPTDSGGGYMGHLAISGRVVNVVFSSAPTRNNVISSFNVDAVIHNDTPAAPTWAAGVNSLEEHLSTTNQSSNTLERVILTVDFAVSSDAELNPFLPPSISPPYRDNNGPYILTTNNDYTGWYCWTPDQGKDVNGMYSSPGWSFGNIPPGSSTNRILSFIISDPNFGTGIEPSDSRYGPLIESYTNGTDIFINRSLSLKISEWISDPAIDQGDGAATNSNVSVFHNTVEDENQVISISDIKWQTSPPGFTLTTTGSTNGIGQQILQVSTNLLTTNWLDVATNPAAWPIPQTNAWTNAISPSPIQFFRIIQQLD